VEGRREGDFVVRLLLAHAFAYPVATAWAFGTAPLVIVALASGPVLDHDTLVHRVLFGVAWPAIAAFVLVHAAGVIWARSTDPRRGRRVFALAMGLLSGLPILAGSASWLWLMTR
jgi:hypothetical protein